MHSSSAGKNAWDFCQLESSCTKDLEDFETLLKASSKTYNPINSICQTIEEESIGKLSRKDGDASEFQLALASADESGRSTLQSLDTVIQVIHMIRSAYDDVTGRTNSLMSKCESLLDQQHTLQSTVEILQKAIQPFEDIEQIAITLGIPYDQPQSSSASIPTTQGGKAINQLAISSLDPRSPEFQDILRRLSVAIQFLKEHGEIMEADRYRTWLEKLQVRAVSLVGRAMRDLIENAAKKCREIIQQKLYSKTANSSNSSSVVSGNNSTREDNNKAQLQQQQLYLEEQQPLESTPIYQKFRGLSYRMKELTTVLVEGGLAQQQTSTVLTTSSSHTNSSNHMYGGSPRYSNHQHQHQQQGQHGNNLSIITEVKQGYALVRMEVLLPFIKEAWITALAQARLHHHHNNNNNSNSNQQVSGSGTNLASIVEEVRGGGNNSSNNNNNKQSSASNNSEYHLSLGVAFRQVFSMLIRVAQLEHQLFESLFQLDSNSSGNNNNNSSSSSISLASRSIDQQQQQQGMMRGASFRKTSNNSYHTQQQHQQQNHYDDLHLKEVLQIIESVSNATRDFLRPLVIRESSVDELCRVISVLGEDMKSQISVLPVPSRLMQVLYTTLEYTINDAKERAIYCAETKLRQEVQFFEPLPSHVAYPEILEALEEKKKLGQGQGQQLLNMENDQMVTGISSQEIYDTWYPPLRHTLSLLSKLYGVVAVTVFEDFARRSIDLCIQTLRVGANGVRRTHPVIHGDLFLVRHLLILREQLMPFEITLQSIEKQLDFSSTGQAFTDFVVNNTRNFLRFDGSNGFLLFAQQGLPSVQELHTDAKKELDTALKKACLSFKQSAMKMLLGPLDAFLAKVAAFLGVDIPYQSLQQQPQQNNNGHNNSNGNMRAIVDGQQQDDTMLEDSSNSNGGSAAAAIKKTSKVNKVPVLTSEQKALLKNQSFIRPERMKECLDQVQSILVQKLPDIKEMIKIYVDSQAAQVILQKSIVQEFEISKRKMECILVNCVDPGQPLREIEHLLGAVSRLVTEELNKSNNSLKSMY